MEKVSGHTRLWRRGAAYYFRAKVPVDLLKHYSPKLEIKFSLKTNDRREAERRVRLEAVKLDDEFAALRSGEAPKRPGDITQTHAVHLAAEWASEILRDDEQDRREGMNDRFFTEQGLDYQEMGRGLRDSLARGRIDIVEATVNERLAQHGLRAAPGTENYRTVAYEFLKAGVQLTERLNARQRGEVVETPQRTPSGPLSPALGGLAFSEVFELWAAERKPPAKTLAEWERIRDRFISLNGDLPVGSIGRGHVVKLKDARVAEGMAPNTVLKTVSESPRVSRRPFGLSQAVART